MNNSSSIHKKSKLLTKCEEFVDSLRSFFKSEQVQKKQYADCIIRNQENSILMLQRVYGDDFMGGKWGFPGGNIEKGEDPADAAKRELFEETGIELIARPRFVTIIERDNCTIHYYEAIVSFKTKDTTAFDNTILLDNEEHRAYEWKNFLDLNKFDGTKSIDNPDFPLIADLSSYVLDLYDLLVPFQDQTVINGFFSNEEEAIANDYSLDMYWQILQKAFDQSMISEEQFLDARDKYFYAKRKEALDVVSKAFDAGMITEEQYLDALKKGGDPSHGGKLIRHVEVDKNGRMVTKWIDPKTGGVPVKIKKEAPLQWWDHFKQYQLNCYPVGIDKQKVEVNESGDVHSHWILKWKDPKSNTWKNAYSKEFMNRNANAKWQRIQNVSSAQIDLIKEKSEVLVDNSVDLQEQEAACIINIIAHTGLRRGDKNKFDRTGNRGVSSLSPENIEINGDTIQFDFIGKSYQENKAEYKNRSIARFLQKLKKEKEGQNYLFDTTDMLIDVTFDEVGGEGLKIKDMRTYVATDLARKMLFEDKTPPPPVPQELSISKQKRLVQTKLKGVYERVAEKLNNTPTMAKNSYIHPNIIDFWLKKLDLKFEVQKSEQYLDQSQLNSDSLDSINKHYGAIVLPDVELNEDDEDSCDYFNEPGWWDDGKLED